MRQLKNRVVLPRCHNNNEQNFFTIIAIVVWKTIKLNEKFATISAMKG